MGMPSPLPVRDGVGATRLHVPMTGAWPTIAAYMVERFFHLDPERLLVRFDRGEIVARDGRPLSRDTPLGAEEFVWYYREPPVEKEIPFTEEILHQDEHLVVVDKPHFLPTTPGGKYLQNSALVRLRNRLGNPDLTPIHRLDRATAGLLMFSARPATRGAYQLLFEDRRVEKMYEAVSARPADWDPSRFPLVYRNRIEKLRGQVCVQVDEDGEPNSETLIEREDAPAPRAPRRARPRHPPRRLLPRAAAGAPGRLHPPAPAPRTRAPVHRSAERAGAHLHHAPEPAGGPGTLIGSAAHDLPREP
ncbi:unnamed protein product, partial [Penicillium discolor]